LQLCYTKRITLSKECRTISGFSRRLIGYLLIFLFCFWLTSIGTPKPYVYIILIVLAGSLFLPFFYSLLRETRIDRLEKFLIQQQRNQELHICYLMANNRNNEAEALLEKMLAKSKSPARKALYTAMVAAHLKNKDAIKEVLPDLPAGQYRSYYEAIVHIGEGNLEVARSLIGVITKPWMKDSLLSEIELAGGNRHEAIAYARQAWQGCRGVQRYVSYKTYERDLPEALASA